MNKMIAVVLGGTLGMVCSTSSKCLWRVFDFLDCGDKDVSQKQTYGPVGRFLNLDKEYNEQHRKSREVFSLFKKTLKARDASERDFDTLVSGLNTLKNSKEISLVKKLEEILRINLKKKVRLFRESFSRYVQKLRKERPLLLKNTVFVQKLRNYFKREEALLKERIKQESRLFLDRLIRHKLAGFRAKIYLFDLWERMGFKGIEIPGI